MVIWLAMACTFIGAEERQDRRDQDGDGYLSAQWGGEDCDDTDAAVNPDQDELCNGIDDDCDGLVDVLEEGGVARFLDKDGDGYGDAAIQVCEGAAGVAELGNDCDDADASVNPAATETCEAADEDCDGLVNEDDPSLDLTTASQGWPDADGDGYGSMGEATVSCEQVLVPESGDCEDTDNTINPGAEEICETDTDEDCDGYSSCVFWELDGPQSGLAIGAVVDAVDLDEDGLDDLILGLPDQDTVGAVWGPAQTVNGLDQSFEGEKRTGIDLDTAPNWRGGKPVVLVGSQGEALLMVARVSGVSLRLSGSQDGFGERVQLLAGNVPWVAVAAVNASEGDDAVFLFDGQQSGNVETDAATGWLKLQGKDEGNLRALEGLDHDGDGEEELAVALERDGGKPEAVLLMQAWAGELKTDEADVELDDEQDEVAALGSGDFDGDGRSDLVVGLPGVSGGRGEILVFFGPIQSSSLSEADLSITGEAGQGLGSILTPMATPEDEDLLVVSGAAGPVWILDLSSGSASLDDAVWSDTCEPLSIAGGDLDGDGWEDLLLGFPDALGGDGQVHVQSGRVILGE